MQPSFYFFDFPIPNRPGYRLLYSSKKGASCVVSQSMADRVKTGKVSAESGETLLKLGMLTTDQAAEKASVYQFGEHGGEKATTLHILIVPGMQCNFSCSYCYEGEKGQERMSVEQQEQLVEAVLKLCSASIQTVKLKFYGGEPLLHMKEISQLSCTLQDKLQDRKIKFSFSLVSNGSLLTPERVARLKPLGLHSIRVTLDGPEGCHNQSRPYLNGQGSYQAILANMKACASEVAISVSGNYTRDNYQRFSELLDDLVAHGLDASKLASVSFGAVMQTKGSDAIGYQKGCVSYTEPWVAEAAIFLRAAIQKRGFAVERILPNLCMIQCSNMVMINWDGHFYKCPVLVNQPEFSIGQLPDLPDHGRLSQVNSWQNDKKCQECKYLPLCYGGCPVMSLGRTGSLAPLDCWRPFFEKVLPAMVQQDFRAKTAKLAG